MRYLGKGAERTTLHFGNEEQVLQSLQMAGFDKAVLPAEIGGTWTYDSFTEWCDERCQFEMERYPSMIPSSAFAALSSQEEHKGIGDHAETANAAAAPAPEKAIAQSALAAFVDSQNREQKASRRRQLRVMYSRQKRKRQKSMINGLHEQVFDLRNEKTDLEKENRRLSKLLSSAREMVKPCEGIMAPSVPTVLDQRRRASPVGSASTQTMFLPSVPPIINLPSCYAPGAAPGPKNHRLPSILATKHPDDRKPPPKKRRR